MSDFGTMQARIARETRRPELGAEIALAIVDAILLYSTQSFWFNSVRMGQSTLETNDGASLQLSDGTSFDINNSLVTRPKQEFYDGNDFGSFAAMPSLARVILHVDDTFRYPLDKQTPQWMDDTSSSEALYGVPIAYSLDAGSLRLFPIPDRQYRLVFYGTGSFVNPALPADTSPWFKEAERLIRCTAKRMLYAEVIRDTGQAQVESSNEQEMLKALKRASARRGGPSRVRVRSWF